MKRVFLAIFILLLFFGIGEIRETKAATATRTSCGEVWNDLTLTKNVSSSDTCFEIKANNITLDCAGHTITGNKTGSGIYDADYDRITIKNCRIRNFQNGITLYYVDNSNFLNNEITAIANVINPKGIWLGMSNNNNFTNNTISNPWIGIWLERSNNNTFQSNNISNTKYGIWVQGIWQDPSEGNTFTSNSVSGNFSLNVGSGNTLIDNDISTLDLYGEKYLYMKNNRLSYFYLMAGDQDSHFDHSIDTSNLLNGKPIYYVKHANNQTYDSSTNAGLFYCLWCNNVKIKNLTLNSSSPGLLFWKTNNSTIENISVTGGDTGIALKYSSGNIIQNSYISKNGSGIILGGINLSGSNNTVQDNVISSNTIGISVGRGNKIIGNQFISNYEGMEDIANSEISSNRISPGYNWSIAYLCCSYLPPNRFYNNYFEDYLGYKTKISDNCCSQWNTTYDCTKGSNIVGGPCWGGNYWPSYCNIIDTNGDGIGDTDLPYRERIVSGDYLPLMKPCSSAAQCPGSGSCVDITCELGYCRRVSKPLCTPCPPNYYCNGKCSCVSNPCGTNTRYCTALTNCTCDLIKKQYICDTDTDKSCTNTCLGIGTCSDCTPPACDRTNQGGDIQNPSSPYCQNCGHCNDLVQDCGEEGIDCGGTCPPCTPPNQAPSATSAGESWNHCAFKGTSKVTFHWKYSDPEGDPQVAYEIWLDDNPGFPGAKFNHLVEHTPLPGPDFAYTLNLSDDDDSDWLSELAWGTTYYWKVKVKDNQGNWSKFSNSDSFTTPAHAYPWPDFQPQPSNPSLGQVVEFIQNDPSVAQALCYNGGEHFCQDSGPEIGYAWDFSYDPADGFIVESTYKGNATTTYSKVDDYTIKLRITDTTLPGPDNYCEEDRTVTIGLPLPRWKEIIPF